MTAYRIGVAHARRSKFLPTILQGFVGVVRVIGSTNDVRMSMQASAALLGSPWILPLPKFDVRSRDAVGRRYDKTIDVNQSCERVFVGKREFIAAAIDKHANTVLRVCGVYLREQADREDAFQETFLRLARHAQTFDGEEHLKAWLIRVASNVCKDMLKSSAAKTNSLDALEEDGFVAEGDDGQEGQRALERQEILSALQSLDEKYRVVLYLKYYEGYTAAQMAEVLNMPENTVYTNLARGRKLLKGVLHG